MKKITLFSFGVFTFLLFLIFRNWLFAQEIVGGDWPYFYQENVNQFSFLPPLWNSLQGGGLGGLSIIYSLDSYLYFTGAFFSQVFHIPWVLVYKIFWFGMFLFLSAISIITLTRGIFEKSSFPYLFLSAFIYITNTYILMVVGGGQMGVALGYALLPFVFFKFIRLLNYFNEEKNNKELFRKSLIAGLFLAVQILFDYRIAYITLSGVFLYALFAIRFKSVAKKYNYFFLLLFTFAIPIVTSLLLHAFWLLPLAFAGGSSVSQLGTGYTTTNAVTFFSFAKLENSLSLMHPYWPENIFGKIGFMKAEFLLLPILALSSLFFIKKSKNQKSNVQQRMIVFFALLGLVGAFLAKGANEPFGGLYLWLFDYVPGFIMFRDPTKWYMLVALSYSILLPFSIWSIYQWLQLQKKMMHFYLSKAFLFIIFSYFLFLLYPALSGQLHGTFVPHTVPSEYLMLKDMLTNQHQFSRTLWVPKMQRYGFASSEHPAIEANALFKASTSAELMMLLQQKDIESKVANLSIAYLIVPYDSEGEIFLKERKYDETQMKKVVNVLDSTTWLKRDSRFKKLSVYKVRNYNNHFFFMEKGKLSYQKYSDTGYNIDINSGNDNTLVFSENYSPYWSAEINGQKIQSKPYNNLNSYDIPATNGKNERLHVFFSLSRYYLYGLLVSISALFVIMISLYILNKKKK